MKSRELCSDCGCKATYLIKDYKERNFTWECCCVDFVFAVGP